MKLLRRSKPEPERVFTGNCMVRCHTMDGYSIGRCYHSTYDGVCRVHGDVRQWLTMGNWPRETDLDRNPSGGQKGDE